MTTTQQTQTTKTTRILSSLGILGPETRWAYSAISLHQTWLQVCVTDK